MAKIKKKYRFCPLCRGNLIRAKEENNYHYVCKDCGWKYYVNPLPSVAAFVHSDNNEILLIKRGIEPGKDKWALPTGFIEHDELPEEAVLRELKEETGIRGKTKGLIGIFTEKTRVYGNILLIGYEIELMNGSLKAGSDTKETRFFPKEQLPCIPFASHRAIIRNGLQKHSTKNLLVEVLKSKITEVIITHTVLHYKGSMGIDGKIMRAANLMPGEKVHVLNYDNGERLETYVIEEKVGSGRFVLYGPASRKGKVGDRLCILSFAFLDMEAARNLKPKVIVLDDKNRIRRIINQS